MSGEHVIWGEEPGSTLQAGPWLVLPASRQPRAQEASPGPWQTPHPNSSYGEGEPRYNTLHHWV